MQEIFNYLNESSEDGFLSKSEKKALKAVLAENSPSKRELDWLRSQIFEIAKSKITGHENQQILEWLEAANKLILPKMSGAPGNKVSFSPGTGCLNTVIELIAYATRSIDVCVFTISDDRIKEKLLYAHKKGVGIRIITDNDKSFDRGSDIHDFVKAGIRVKVDSTAHHMHHKFAVFDHKTLLTGSYNWTRSATEHNQENTLTTHDPQTVQAYHQEFEKLWKETVRY